MLFIGNVRRFFFVQGNHKWNAWVRDFTAFLEGTWLIRANEN